MAFKFVVFAAFVAIAKAGVIGTPAVLAPGAPLLAPRFAAPLASPYLAPRIAAPLAAPLATPYLAPRLAAPLAAPLGVAAPLAYAAPIAKTIVPAAISTYDPSPAYSYSYDIQDALTGDSKNQQETRKGDVVIGSYSLTEPDGTRRIVEYTADPLNGFNAVVRREPLVVAKAVVAAPAYAKVAAPLAYAAPIARAPLAVAAPGYAKLAAPALLG